MEKNQRLADRMSNASDKYGPDDTNWNQFIKDHKKYLRSISELTEYTVEAMTRYRYRPEEFFMTKIKGPYQAAWIWLFINDIRNMRDFNASQTQFYMFKWADLEKLYSVYKSSSSSSKS